MSCEAKVAEVKSTRGEKYRNKSAASVAGASRSKSKKKALRLLKRLFPNVTQVEPWQCPTVDLTWGFSVFHGSVACGLANLPCPAEPLPILQPPAFTTLSCVKRRQQRIFYRNSGKLRLFFSFWLFLLEQTHWVLSLGCYVLTTQLRLIGRWPIAATGRFGSEPKLQHSRRMRDLTMAWK